jgi:hypothetical protein
MHAMPAFVVVLQSLPHAPQLAIVGPPLTDATRGTSVDATVAEHDAETDVEQVIALATAHAVRIRVHPAVRAATPIETVVVPVMRVTRAAAIPPVELAPVVEIAPVEIPSIEVASIDIAPVTIAPVAIAILRHHHRGTAAGTATVRTT